MPVKNRSKVIPWVLYIIWCVAITLLAYGTALRLPLFFDDLVHLPFVDKYSLVEMWQTAGSLAYYRPLPFTVWDIMYTTLGRHDPLLQHGFNLLLHMLNGILVGWLAGQLWPKFALFKGQDPAGWLRSFMSATVFLLFPFSYQAVPWVGSLAHLLVTFLVLLSLATYWQYRLSGRKIWGALSLVFAFLAPFAHENGILVGPLLAAILFTGQDWRDRLMRNLTHILLWSLPALLWLPIWWFAPKAVDGSIAVRIGETMFQNSAYFLQGATYPLTWLGGWVRSRLGINDMTVTAVLGFIALAGAASLQWLGGATRRSLLPWLWVFIAAIPAILFLSFDYVINGPRLLMLASVGVAWLWTDVAIVAISWIHIADRRSLKRGWPRITLVLAIFGALLLQNYIFIKNRMSLHEILGQTQQQAISLTTASNEVGRKAVFVNLPTWLAPGTTTYALGHEGVQFLPNYAPPETLVSVNTGLPAELEIIRYEAIRPEMPYHYGLGSSTADWPEMAKTRSDVFVTDYDLAGITFRPAGAFLPLPTSDEPLAIFSDPMGSERIELLSAKAIRDKNDLQVNLTWHVEGQAPDQVTVFVHVLDEQGDLISQMDGDPLGGSFPLSLWPPGTSAEDRRVITLEDGSETVLIGLYDRLSGERWLALSTEEDSWPEDAVPVLVE